MFVPSFQSACINPLSSDFARQDFICSQANRFGISPADISSCSFLNGDFKIYINTGKKSIIDRVINTVYGTNKKKYLGLDAVNYWGETSIIVK
jgi:hypothetical protein